MLRAEQSKYIHSEFYILWLSLPCWTDWFLLLLKYLLVTNMGSSEDDHPMPVALHNSKSYLSYIGTSFEKNNNNKTKQTNKTSENQKHKSVDKGYSMGHTVPYYISMTIKNLFLFYLTLFCGGDFKGRGWTRRNGEMNGIEGHDVKFTKNNKFFF